MISLRVLKNWVIEGKHLIKRFKEKKEAEGVKEL